MKLMTLGMSDIKVSAIAFGTWRLVDGTGRDAANLLSKVVARGLNLIDTADIYGFGTPAGFGGTEALLGKAFKEAPSLRHQIILATKGGITPPRPYDSSYEYLMGALEASLDRLNTDYVDLYQIHRPDVMTPMPETARCLEDMVKSGKARAVGVSNFTVSQTEALQAHLPIPLASTQPEFSAIRQDPKTDGTLDWCSKTGATCLAWSPLGGGSLATGQGDHPRLSDVKNAIDRVATELEVSAVQVALSFLMSHAANVIPIIGTMKLERVEEAVETTEIKLPARAYYDIVEAYRGLPMP